MTTRTVWSLRLRLRQTSKVSVCLDLVSESLVFCLVSNTFVFAASVPPPEKKIEKPVERKKPTKLLVDLADKETCSDKQRYAGFCIEI